MTSVIKNTLRKIFKGEEGEIEVIKAISNILGNGNLENPSFFILNRVIIPDITSSKEIDILLLHPVLGIYVIEVKNWDNIKYLLNEKNNPFKSIKEKADLLKTFLNENLRTLPINIEHRVVFPSISSEEGEKFFRNYPSYKRYKNITFFRDDLLDQIKFSRFFSSSSNNVPTREQFINIAKLLTDGNIPNKNIIPILSKDKISFFDYKQLSVLNGYTGGFRIIRGVAGTGKTLILINFIVSKPNKKILTLCFNKRLKNSLSSEIRRLKKYSQNNVYIYSLFEFLNEINFDFNKFNLKDKSLKQQYFIFETKEAIYEFQIKLKNYLKKNPISIFLCDETQDMPAGFIRVILNEIKNCIFFIDEGQKFYPYTMDSIKDVFYHPEFEENISMRGKVRNLKTIYRTPSNISKCALEILSLDKSINNYYKKAKYIENNLLSDINYILEDGKIFIGNFDSFNKILEIIYNLPQNKKTYILTYTKENSNKINTFLEKKNIRNAKAIPLQSVKGLEADNIIIHSFDHFLIKSYEIDNEREIMFRKIYVLLTRARENIFLSIKENSYLKIENKQETKIILDIIKKYAELYNPERLSISYNSINKEEINNNFQKTNYYFNFNLIKDVVEFTDTIFNIVGNLFK